MNFRLYCQIDRVALWDPLLASYVVILLARFVLWMFVNPNRSAVGDGNQA